MLINNNNNTYYNNINVLTEEDFSIIDPNTILWEGKLPFDMGDTFPTPFIRERANIIKTNDTLYKGEQYKEIFRTLFNFNDMLRDAVTNLPVLNLIPSLPDYRLVTDTWTDLLAAESPTIDGQDNKRITQVSTIMGVSNYAETFQELVKASLFKHGNAVCRVDMLLGGNPRVVLMPLKTWIPMVSPKDPTSILVNAFFNIYPSGGNSYECEFILYHEGGEDAGKVEKYVFEYFKSSKQLGQLLDYKTEEAFGGAGVSPIVVFTGQRAGASVYGEGQYRKWEPSITASMKAFGTILTLLERTKEINRIIPEGATHRDEHTGVTYSQQTGSMQYDIKDGRPAKDYVDYAIPIVPMEEAINAYKETLTRVSRDTDLSYTMFDTKELGTQMTGKALKVAMYRTELRATSLSTLINNSAKQLVCKLALASGVNIEPGEFTLMIESGFVTDQETTTEVMSKRLGNTPSISLVDAIVRMDGVTRAEAENRANEILGLPQNEVEETELTDSGDKSLVTDITLTAIPDTLETHIQGPNNRPDTFLFGDEDILK